MDDRDHQQRRRRSVAAIGITILAALITWLLLRDGSHPAAPKRTESAATPEPPPPPRRRAHVAPDSPPQAPPSDPPIEPTPPSQPVVASALVDALVRDVWNEAPVPYLEFALPANTSRETLDEMLASKDPGSGRWIVASDAGGRLRLPLTGLRLESMTPGWTLVELSKSGPGQLPVVWVYATMTIQGSVVTADANGAKLDMRSVHLRTWAHGQDTYPGFSTPPDGVTISEQWLDQQHLSRFGDLPPVSRQGLFRFQVPRVRAIVLHARVQAEPPATTSGWQDASVRITDEMCEALRADVRLVLRPGYRITATLLDEEGLPVRNATVVLHVIQTLKMEDVTPSRLLSFGHVYTAKGNKGGETATVDFQVQAGSDETGRFEIVAKVDGEATLHITPETRHRTTNVGIGGVSNYEDREPLVVRSAKNDDVVRFVDQHGRPMAGKQLTFNDFTLDPVQTTLVYKLGERGEIPARLLIPGNQYNISVRNPGHVMPIARAQIDWNGESEVQVPPLRRR